MVLPAALTLSQFCSRIKRRKSHFPNFPKVCLALGRLSLLLLSFSFVTSLYSYHILFAFLPPLPFSILHILLFFLPLLPLLFLPLLLNSPPFHLMASTCKNAWVLLLAIFLTGPWVLSLAVFIFFFASVLHPSTFHHNCPSLSMSSCPSRGEREPSRGCFPFLGVPGFLPPRLPQLAF